MSKIAFLFPGQGAQSVGMGHSAWKRYDAVKDLFVQASDILGFSIADYCFEGPKEKLDSTAISQPALFVTSMAALEFLKEENPEAIESCAGAAGLSLGEYSALAFAGAITFEEGLRLVQKRGEAMQAAADACPSGMVRSVCWASMRKRFRKSAIRHATKAKSYNPRIICAPATSPFRATWLPANVSPKSLRLPVR